MSLFKPMIAASLLLGAALGIGGYTYIYAGGYAYMGNDPAACANCHVMGEHYTAWLQSSHSAVATCNDCHTPPGTVAKYASKAGNGFRHSLAFTTGGFPDRLRITAANTRVTEQACRKCHAELVAPLDDPQAHKQADGGNALSCVHCHANVGHWTR
jgi:cytochrome c nitrite reductase small subunit